MHKYGKYFLQKRLKVHETDFINPLQQRSAQLYLIGSSRGSLFRFSVGIRFFWKLRYSFCPGTCCLTSFGFAVFCRNLTFGEFQFLLFVQAYGCYGCYITWEGDFHRDGSSDEWVFVCISLGLVSLRIIKFIQFWIKN